jgi:hypothetical protein
VAAKATDQLSSPFEIDHDQCLSVAKGIREAFSPLRSVQKCLVVRQKSTFFLLLKLG